MTLAHRILTQPTEEDLVAFYAGYQSDEDDMLTENSELKFGEISTFLGHLGVEPDSSTSLLDFGCGNGALLEKMRQRYGLARAVGLEYSSAKLTDIESTYPMLEIHLQPPGVELACADKSFDYTLFCDVIEHVIDPKLLLQELSRVTRLGIIMLVPLEANIEHLQRLIKPSIRYMMGRPPSLLQAFGGHIQFWNHYSFVKLLREVFPDSTIHSACTDKPFSADYRYYNFDGRTMDPRLWFRMLGYLLVLGHGKLYSLWSDQTGLYYVDLEK